MILSDFNKGEVRWYFVCDKHPNWVVKCPDLELVLTFDNLRQLGKTPGIFDAMRVTNFCYDSCTVSELPDAIEWYRTEVISQVPLSYKSWLSYLYEISGQKIRSEDINSWSTQPLRLLVSSHDLMMERRSQT